MAKQDLDKISAMLHLNIESLTILSSLFVRDYSNVEGTQLINVSSGGGYTIVGNAITYCATKFYVSAFTEGLSHELKSQGALMQAKVLAPAATETEFAKLSSISPNSNIMGLCRNIIPRRKWLDSCLTCMITIMLWGLLMV